MLTMKKVLKQHQRILTATLEKDQRVDVLRKRAGCPDSFDRALQDLICDGQVYYCETNPHLKIRRRA